MAPEFTEEDLVPVEMPDLDVSDFSGSDAEDGDEGEEEEGEKEAAVGETAGEEVTESKPAAVATGLGKAASHKSSRQVIRDLDEKISKYKQFLERAKSKHFSAIRFVTPKALKHPSFGSCFIALIFGAESKAVAQRLDANPLNLESSVWSGHRP